MAQGLTAELLRAGDADWNRLRAENPNIVPNLWRANLRDANLRNANLYAANLRNADLRYADLRYADLRYADLQDAGLQDANLYAADLRYADLRNADLYGANLGYANLEYANLRDAHLEGANLRYANLGAANLRYANLYAANLSETTGIHYYGWTGIGRDARAGLYVHEQRTVYCGCFRGTVDEFEARIRETHDDSLHGRNYLAQVAIIRQLIEQWEAE